MTSKMCITLLLASFLITALRVHAEPIPWGGGGGGQGQEGGSWGGQQNGGGGWGNGASQRSGGGGGWAGRNSNGGAGQGGGWGGRSGGADLRSPDGKLYGANLIEEPDRYGYESNIPGATASFYGYRSAGGRSGGSSFGRSGQENGHHSQNHQGFQGRPQSNGGSWGG